MGLLPFFFLPLSLFAPFCFTIRQDEKPVGKKKDGKWREQSNAFRDAMKNARSLEDSEALLGPITEGVKLGTPLPPWALLPLWLALMTRSLFIFLALPLNAPSFGDMFSFCLGLLVSHALIATFLRSAPLTCADRRLLADFLAGPLSDRRLLAGHTGPSHMR